MTIAFGNKGVKRLGPSNNLCAFDLSLSSYIKKRGKEI